MAETNNCLEITYHDEILFLQLFLHVKALRKFLPIAQIEIFIQYIYIYIYIFIWVIR